MTSNNTHGQITALERVEASEKLLGVRLDYMREMAATGSPVLDQMQAFTALARENAGHSGINPDIRRYATLGAVQADDCGECVQIHVNLDRTEGADPALLRLALAGKADELPAPLGLAWRFGQAVAKNDPEMEELRLRLEAICGRAAILELSFAIAAARFYPTVKRAMGYALSCSRIEVAA